MEYSNVMIDLETLGNEPNSLVTEIAAVPFNWGEERTPPEDNFYVKINIQSSLDKGLKVNGSTLEWWSQQDPELIKSYFNQLETISLSEALYKFTQYIQSLKPSTLCLWGNSNRFDLGLIHTSYMAIGKEIPWLFRNERDVRTLVSLAPQFKDSHIWAGTKHDPIIDCYNQIEYCKKTYKFLKNGS